MRRASGRRPLIYDSVVPHSVGVNKVCPRLKNTCFLVYLNKP
jgi:hypothetical protein